MKLLKISSLATALLAGTAMATLPALSQEAEVLQKRLLQHGEQTEGTSETEGSVQIEGATEMEGTTQSDAATDAEAAEGQADAETLPGSGQSNEQSARDEAPGQEVQSGEAESATDAAPGQLQNSGEVDSATEAAPGQVKQDDQAATEEPSEETTASINISEEQTTEIRNVIVESDVEPVEVDFEVEIGVAVPETIELRPLPPRIVEIVPEYEGYLFLVLADGRIIIVEPDTHEVVYIIVA